MVFGQATRAELDQGLLYYTVQRQEVEQLRNEFGFTVEVAVLSPNKRESDTYADLATCMRHVRDRLLGIPRVCAYPKNRDKALRILRGTNPEHVLRGSKVLSFYFNTIEPKNPLWVTVDGHLVSAWMGRVLRMRQARISRQEYDLIRKDVMHAAKSVDILPCQFHSTIWVGQRRLSKHPDQAVFDF
jgi:hypothetical protein